MIPVRYHETNIREIESYFDDDGTLIFSFHSIHNGMYGIGIAYFSGQQLIEIFF